MIEKRQVSIKLSQNLGHTEQKFPSPIPQFNDEAKELIETR